MKKIEKVTLIGLGAMGVFFAPKLNAYLGMKNFQVLADGERKERIEAKGVTVNGVKHQFSVIAPSEQGDTSDLIIIAVKDTGLSQAIEDIRNQVGPHTQILCVMNGIDSEEKVAKEYGWDHVLYSYMRVSIAMEDGVANFNPFFGKVHFGEAKNEGLSERVCEIKTLFEECGISYQIDPDMIRGLWFKFMCNVGENMTCALLGVPFGAFRESEHASKIRRSLMWEVVKLANKLDIDLGQGDIDGQEDTIKKIPPFNKPSTLQDLERNRKTEIEMFAGKTVKLGQALGVETPLNWLVYHGICVLEEKNNGLFDFTSLEG